MEIKFKKIDPAAKLPQFAHPNDAGFDIFSLEDVCLAVGERHLFSCGLAAEITSGFAVIIKPKSGLAVKSGIDVLAGVIDSGYRGEWKILLINLGAEPVSFRKGDKIAQGLVYSKPAVELTITNQLSDSLRQKGGFGSTGK